MKLDINPSTTTNKEDQKMNRPLPTKVTCSPRIPELFKERQLEHRRNLMLAMHALPSEEVLDLVAAALVSRSDYFTDDVKKFSAEMSNWAWPYVVTE